MNVAVVGGDSAAGSELVAGLEGLDTSVTTLPAEPWGGRDEIRLALDEAVRPTATLDGVVIASVGAACAERRPLAELDPSAWNEGVERPLHRTLAWFQAAFGCLREGGGAMVLLVPTLSLSGAAGFVPWAAVTEGQRALAKAAARAWGTHAITVNCVAVPGDVLATAAQRHADKAPFDRAGLPARTLRADAAPVVHALLSPAWRSVTGTTVAVDGGMWMTP
jgi:NAD(P)-dependent dehydrogenase (short-subunit alcohol dehydrogenase family)